MFRLADRVIAVTESVRQSLLSDGFRPWKVKTVINGVVGSHRPEPVSDFRLEQPSILTVAGMSHRKGIRDLLQAFEWTWRAYPALHLYLAGDGPQRVEFEAFANSLASRGNIHFLGFRHDAKHLMRQCSIFALASHRESFGLVLAEAREAGCCIVATDVDGIPEVLDYGAAGMLVPPGEPEEFAEKFVLLLGNPGRRQFVAEAAKIGLERFSVAAMTGAVMAVYQDAIGGC